MNANIGKLTSCDNCVCENSKHFCGGSSTCEMACHDFRGCHDFSMQHIRYACSPGASPEPEKKGGSKVGLAVGLALLVVAVASVAAFVYFKRSIAPRLSRIPGNDLLDEALVSDRELKDSVSGGSATLRSVASTNNAVQGVGQSDYNEL
jgi:hypothetical protein